MMQGKSGNKKLLSLQVCRGIAACLVVLYHFTYFSKEYLGHHFLKSFFLFGHAGVIFFFVLSGFIISYTHWKDIDSPSRLNRYTLRRLTRIFPSYWPILIITTILFVFFQPYSENIHSLPIDGIIFLKNIFLVSYSQDPIVLSAWTLQYELFFYIMFGLFIINMRIGSLLLIAWLATIFVFKLGYFNSFNFIKFVGSYYCLAFMMGSGAAYLIRKEVNYPFASIPLLSLCCGVSLFLINGMHEVYFPRLNNFYLTLIYSFSSFLIILGLVKIEIKKELTFPKTFLFLGEASYSIYLTHRALLFLLLATIQHFAGGVTSLLHYSILSFSVLLICVMTGCLYYWLYEKPVLNYLRKQLRKLYSEPEKISPDVKEFSKNVSTNFNLAQIK